LVYLFVEARTSERFELLDIDFAGHMTQLRKSPPGIWALPSRDGKDRHSPAQQEPKVWTMDARQL
jgi:hypothetical protein